MIEMIDTMRLTIKTRIPRKKYLILVFLLIAAITLFFKQYFYRCCSQFPENYDEVLKWDMNEWFQIKSEFNNMMSNLSFKTFPNDLEAQKYLEHCQKVPDGLKKRIKIFKYPRNFNATTNDVNDYIKSNYFQTSSGRWTPATCRARHRIAIIIPYKDRLDNLNYFLTHMHPFLQRQELEYQIFVVEQFNDQPFNKGILMNAGFLELMGLGSNQVGLPNVTFPFDCVIFHDVDLLPEDDRIMYSCPFYKPRHLSVAIDKYKYKMAYYRLIGGVLNFRASHFVKVNGYSNSYWGWGAEDDDMEIRLSKIKLGFERPNINIAHYRMLKHSPRFKNPIRGKLLHHAHNRFTVDGINNVNYTVVQKKNHKLFTHIFIDVGLPPKYIQEILHPKPKKNVIHTSTNDSSTKASSIISHETQFIDESSSRSFVSN